MEANVKNQNRMKSFPALWFACGITVASTLSTTACQTTAAAKEEVTLPPVKIVAEPTGPDGLEVYDAETLFQRGLDLIDGGAYADAAGYFERLIDEFPASSRVRLAHFNRGECYLAMKKGTPALEAFNAFLQTLPGGGDVDQIDDPLLQRLSRRGRFKKGEALALLERYDDVAELFDLMLVEDLSDAEHVEALTDSGIGHYMRGDIITAEYRFIKARRIHKRAAKAVRMTSKFHVAQATFYLAEIARTEFETFKLRPPTPEEIEARVAKATEEGAKDGDQEGVIDDGQTPVSFAVERLMGEQLEEKCQRLIRAQVAFLRVIREGHSGWASASGYRVGTMYEHLYDEMVSMPVPPDLTESQRELFREVMADRVSILLQKAIRTWESTAQMATRTDTDNEWVEKTRESLSRVKELVLAHKASKGSAS